VIDDQVAGVAFEITIRAVDQHDAVATDYSGTATLTDLTGTIDPDVTTAFVDGVWRGDVTITQARGINTITATDGNITGTSNEFAVKPAVEYDKLLTLHDGWTLFSTDKWIDAGTSAFEGYAMVVYRHDGEIFVQVTDLAVLEPVEALYVYMPGGGWVGLNYDPDVVPGPSVKNLVAGWNLVSSATYDNAKAVFSPLRYAEVGGQQAIGLATVVAQGGYNVNGSSFYLSALTDADWDILAEQTLDPFDGYWVYMNAPKGFGVIPE